jgi:hypothetical protein
MHPDPLQSTQPLHAGKNHRKEQAKEISKYKIFGALK